ncbi:MAG: hypothetical protein B7Z37_08180 [Verrucomicrobia bacterium 12-59-8]|nr:MAG: hypothetical protein B7Z37_08180 [Verrucomicrobia bacterium 12-59-8]
MPRLYLSEAQKYAIRYARTPEVACHLVYHATDDAFNSRYPDDITGWIRDVLCVETYFGAMCDGGVVTWFDWDHGRLAHLVPDALRAVGLPEFAPGAEKALEIHLPPPYPATIQGWSAAIEQIRDAQLEDDFDASAYDAIEQEFFALYHADKTYFRTKLHRYVLDHFETEDIELLHHEMDEQLRAGHVSRDGLRRLWDAECYGNVSSLGALRKWLRYLEQPLNDGKCIEIEGGRSLSTRPELIAWIKENFRDAYFLYYKNDDTGLVDEHPNA